MMENAIVIVILIAIIVGAVRYLCLAKKRGETCVGCPHAKQCGGNCNGGCHGESAMTNNKKTHE